MRPDRPQRAFYDSTPRRKRRQPGREAPWWQRGERRSTTQISTTQISTTQISTTQISTTQISMTQMSYEARFAGRRRGVGLASRPGRRVR